MDGTCVYDCVCERPIRDIGPEGMIMALECDIILLQKLMYLKLPSESTKYLVLSLLF